MTDDNDMALMALLKAAEADPSLSSELLRKSYAIERRHQFDRDDTRELSMQELKSLLEAMVDEEISA
ncbi:hypothetical protein L8T00_14295 [Enterobacter cloacae]|jgi:hypothetical protein|uniref:hypothetical protein n=1 Tax=Enterobacter TaxID=547 RepID=UPI001CC5B186|nr:MULTISPECIES: hypothetical protein [Enterobacter]HAV1922608.1 hypothetical protein [Enterobacter hormaechei subsp. steigerwaltii]HDT4041333.1 hypothetical protein [Enterobacter kobei]MCK6856283.1 hypothetical protein [Enterobacter cloacae]UAY66757.1 hypothetical protein K9O83_02675 [Enterobacter bugandensis]WNZ50734.1 hypothetical protein O0R42_18755 [Enterobacter hormaechei subsp. xiangfangensis]